MSRRTFKVILVKPSHYDADGYVIQWWRSLVPSNSLASLYGLIAECAGEKALGPDVDIEVEAYDESNTVIDTGALTRKIATAGTGLIGLVGVQSNQFPRALDLARTFRAAGLPVVIGGFHVSGCLSMLPELPSDLRSALDNRRYTFRRRGRGPYRRANSRRRRGPSEINLQLSQRPAGNDGGNAADPASLGGDPHRPALQQFRCRPWLLVSMQLLYDHQCAGSQIA